MRWRLGLALAGAALAWAIGWGPIADWLYREGPEALIRARPPAPTVLFVVLDTVRADHLSLCGYERPTSPALEALRDRGAAWTCEAVAPGSWTLPSHASYFTGLDPARHGAHALPAAGELLEDTSEQIRPLPDDIPTLAEQLSARGYQTLALSGNPVIAAPSGLSRGFDRSVAASRFGAIPAPELIGRLRFNLRQKIAPDRPLFVFLNFADAHQPWGPTREDWLPPRGPLRLYASREGALWRRWYSGALSGTERQRFLRQLSDVYDQGVADADAGMGEALALLEDWGWCRAGCRVVVTSDHGEFIGEHGLIDHGHYLWQPDVGVPLLYWDSRGEVPTLPAPVSAAAAYHLSLDGTLPELPVSSAAWPHRQRAAWAEGRAYTETSAALWTGGDKLLWVDGALSRYDLSADPEELHPLPAEGHPDLPALLALAARVQASGDEGAQIVDPELSELLRAAGYLE